MTVCTASRQLVGVDVATLTRVMLSSRERSPAALVSLNSGDGIFNHNPINANSSGHKAAKPKPELLVNLLDRPHVRAAPFMLPQPAQSAQPVEQHYRVTLETARRHYAAGHLTATGLIYFAIATQRAPGWKLRMNAETCEKELGIKKTAFYHAISQLKADGFIEWEAPGGINAWISKNDAVEALPSMFHSQQESFSANAEKFPRSRKTVRIRGKVSATAENEVAKSASSKDCETPPDIQQISNKSSATRAAAADKILARDLCDEQLSVERGGQSKPVELDDLNHSVEMVGEEDQGEKEVNGEAAKLTVEGKCSAVQLEALKKLDLVPSYGFRTEIAAASPEAVEKAIACFKEDKATWTAGQMLNPTGVFLTALKQVREEGRQPQQNETKLDPARADLENWNFWRRRWLENPINQRPIILQDMQRTFPGWKIALDPNEGPVRRR